MSFNPILTLGQMTDKPKKAYFGNWFAFENMVVVKIILNLEQQEVQ